jgi:hypothetical protein
MASLVLDDLFADHTRIDPALGWMRVPVAEIFADELLPILDNTPKLQSLFEEAVADWLENHPLMKKRVGKWRFNSHTVSPFMMTHTDAAVMFVDEAIEAAYDAGDPLAHSYHAITMLLTDEAGLGLTKTTIKELERKCWAIEKNFEPQRDEAQFWTPRHSCRTFNALPAWALAREWEPEAEWRILEGPLHTTVIAPREKLVFDLVLCEMPDVDPVEFACRPAPETVDKGAC